MDDNKFTINNHKWKLPKVLGILCLGYYFSITLAILMGNYSKIGEILAYFAVAMLGVCIIIILTVNFKVYLKMYAEDFEELQRKLLAMKLWVVVLLFSLVIHIIVPLTMEFEILMMITTIPIGVALILTYITEKILQKQINSLNPGDDKIIKSELINLSSWLKSFNYSLADRITNPKVREIYIKHKKILYTISLVCFVSIILVIRYAIGFHVNLNELTEKNGLICEIGSNKPFSGQAFSKWESGQIQEIRNFKNGKLEGEWVKYFRNGNIQLRAQYKNNQLQGDFITFNNSGEIESRERYIDGLSESERVILKIEKFVSDLRTSNEEMFYIISLFRAFENTRYSSKEASGIDVYLGYESEKEKILEKVAKHLKWKEKDGYHVCLQGKTLKIKWLHGDINAAAPEGIRIYEHDYESRKHADQIMNDVQRVLTVLHKIKISPELNLDLESVSINEQTDKWGEKSSNFFKRFSCSFDNKSLAKIFRQWDENKGVKLSLIAQNWYWNLYREN